MKSLLGIVAVMSIQGTDVKRNPAFGGEPLEISCLFVGLQDRGKKVLNLRANLFEILGDSGDPIFPQEGQPLDLFLRYGRV